MNTFAQILMVVVLLANSLLPLPGLFQLDEPPPSELLDAPEPPKDEFSDSMEYGTPYIELVPPEDDPIVDLEKQMAVETPPEKQQKTEDIKLSVNPAIYIPGKPIILGWQIKHSEQLLIDDMHVSLKVPEGIIPEDPGLVKSMGEDRILNIPVESTHFESKWLLTKDAVLPLYFSVSLINNGSELDSDTAVLDKGNQEIAMNKGGYVSGLNGKVKIDVPSTVADQDLVFEVRNPSQNKQPSYSLTWNPIEIIAVGKNTGLNVTKFKEPITLQIKYEEDEIFDWSENDLVIFYYDEETNQWHPIKTVVDSTNNILIAQTDHLTVFDYKASSWQGYSLPSLDSFKISDFTGAATYAINFWTPPGPGGLQPSLTLHYNSQIIDESSAYTQASWVGMGWSLETGAITRNMHETNDNLHDDTFGSLGIAVVGATYGGQARPKKR